MPTVSVVIPAYNAEQYILETIRSVQNQTFSAFEILVVDDGSTDQTLALLETLNEPRLRVITGQHKGVSAARNCGIAAAQGEFIAFLDADDLWTPDKLQDQVEALQRSPAAGLAYSWTYYWMYAVEKASRTTSLVRSQVSGTDAYRTFLQENVVTSGSNITVRRAAVAAVGGFDESLTHGEDWEFCCRIARTWEVILIPKPQVFYRQHGTSICSNLETVQSSSLRAIDKIFALAPVELQPLKAKTQSNLYLFLTGLYLARTATVEGIGHARRTWFEALRTYPLIGLSKRALVLAIKLGLLSLVPLRLIKALTHSTRHWFSTRISVP